MQNVLDGKESSNPIAKTGYNRVWEVYQFKKAIKPTDLKVDTTVELLLNYFAEKTSIFNTGYNSLTIFRRSEENRKLSQVALIVNLKDLTSRVFPIRN